MKRLLRLFTPTQWLLITVVALGYFVDFFDLMLFSAVRQPSLRAIGVPETDLATIGISLLNWQLVGLLLGGLLWGILADKKGRLTVLFASILAYSLANIANAYVASIGQYQILRFIAGVGLAGELGVGITLVAESLPKEKRTYAIMVVSALGLCGGATAALVSASIGWQSAYWVGGSMGLGLLILRFSVRESPIFQEARTNNVPKGDILYLFSQPKLLLRYLFCILSGVTAFMFTAIFITLSPEFAKANGLKTPVSVNSVLVIYLFSLAISDILAGLWSKMLGSRKKVLYYYGFFQIIAVGFYLYYPLSTTLLFYVKCGLLGASVGSWGVLVTNAAEQFGTNLRATVTTSVTNFFRAFAIPATLLFQALIGGIGIIQAGAVVGLLYIGFIFLGISQLNDNFEKTLDFTE